MSIISGRHWNTDTQVSLSYRKWYSGYSDRKLVLRNLFRRIRAEPDLPPDLARRGYVLTYLKGLL